MIIVLTLIAIVDKASIEAENGQKVLAEIRHKVDKEGLKKTKAQNILVDGSKIAKAVKEDVIKAKIPEEMEPIRENLTTSLDKRTEVYNQLFHYYDFLDEKYQVSGDALLQESIQLFKEVQINVEQFRK